MPTVATHAPAPYTAPKSIISLPIIILLILILLAILGGFYYWYTLVIEEANTITATRPTAEANNEPESTTAEARTQTLDVVSTSDELPAIRADLESTKLDDLDTEIPAIESELNAATAPQ